MNVLVLGSRIIGSKLAEDLVKAFLGAKFTNEERHVRRLNKVKSAGSKVRGGLETVRKTTGSGGERRAHPAERYNRDSKIFRYEGEPV